MNEQTLTEPVRDLLAAVLEAIDLPHPASAGGTEAHDRLLAIRASHARIALRSVLDDGPHMGPAWDAAYLRERLAEHPVTGYVTVDQAHAALDAGKSWSEAVTLPGDDPDGRSEGWTATMAVRLPGDEAPEPLYGGDVDQFISDAYDSLADSDLDDEPGEGQ